MRLKGLKHTCFGSVIMCNGQPRHISALPGYYKDQCGYWLRIDLPGNVQKYCFVLHLDVDALATATVREFDELELPKGSSES